MHFELFLVLRPVRELLSEARIMLNPLAALHPSYLDSVEAYYSATVDAALICLRFGEAISERETCRILAEQIEELGLPIVVPMAMERSEVEHFYNEHLPHYEYYVQQYPCRGGDSVIHRILDALASQVESCDRFDRKPTVKYEPERQEDDHVPPTEGSFDDLPIIEGMAAPERAPSEWTLG
jgi:hypothetical protein